MELLADRPPSASKAVVLGSLAVQAMVAGDHDDSIRVSQEAYAIADELDLVETKAGCLITIGTSRAAAGDKTRAR